MNAYIQRTQCEACKEARRCHQRVLHEDEEVPSEIHHEPFSSAPAVYSYNVPRQRYFATHLRAREFAKQTKRQLTWCYAKDVPLHRDDRELTPEALDAKRCSWLGRHDQDTGHLSSIFPLVEGLPIRLSESIDRDYQLFRSRRGFLYGWVPHSECNVEDVDGEFLMDRLLVCIYGRFPGAEWRIGDLPRVSIH